MYKKKKNDIIYVVIFLYVLFTQSHLRHGYFYKVLLIAILNGLSLFVIVLYTWKAPCGAHTSIQDQQSDKITGRVPEDHVS